MWSQISFDEKSFAISRISLISRKLIKFLIDFFSINSYSSKIINHQRHGKKSELICVDDHHEKLENDRAKK